MSAHALICSTLLAAFSQLHALKASFLSTILPHHHTLRSSSLAIFLAPTLGYRMHSSLLIQPSMNSPRVFSLCN
ncbi:hypothetical protein EDD21DRAFT_382540 [Dissophora ornata]|nr:hypothetical protein EDD21DRAFT_382540 [Dissophora ornata]